MYIHLVTLLFETPASGFFPLIFEKNNNGLDSVTRETGASSRLRPRSRAGAMTDDVDQRAPYDRTKAKEGDTVFIFAGKHVDSFIAKIVSISHKDGIAK